MFQKFFKDTSLCENERELFGPHLLKKMLISSNSSVRLRHIHIFVLKGTNYLTSNSLCFQSFLKSPYLSWFKNIKLIHSLIINTKNIVITKLHFDSAKWSYSLFASKSCKYFTSKFVFHVNGQSYIFF